MESTFYRKTCPYQSLILKTHGKSDILSNLANDFLATPLTHEADSAHKIEFHFYLTIQEDKEMVAQTKTITDTSQSNGQTDLNAQELKKELSGTLTITSPDKKFNENPWVVSLGTLAIPTAAMLTTLLVGLVGVAFTLGQFVITNVRQDADSADKARETKEKVLSDYSKAITELLVTENKLGVGEGGFIVNRDQANMAKGETLIALRQLQPDKEPDKEKGLKGLLIDWHLLEPVDTSKLDRGENKGLLIRYLYGAKLIGFPFLDKQRNRQIANPLLNLGGADLTGVNLEHVWLPNIGLQQAELSDAKFENANLSQANLIGAVLTKADFSGANLSGTDLRFATLKTAQLDGAKLSGACYVEGTEAQFFPEGFDPVKAGMKAMRQEKSDPSKPNDFEPCVKL